MNSTLIHQAFTEKTTSFNEELKTAVLSTLSALDEGKVRICEKKETGWQVNEWVKEAILLYFRMEKMRPFQAGDFNFFDKVPLKKWTGKEGVRVVPQALVRKGAFVEKNSVLMPSYINIGAYVGEGALIDTWATVGSCAQVGARVHVSGGVGLGGVLEPVQARPVIIEDDVFLGSRSIIVEGVQVKSGAVIGAGTVITASTPILDVCGTEVQTLKGEVPENSVVIPGSRSKQFPAGEYQVPCALIIGKRSESTNKKISLNECLREFNVPV
ncbi:MAG: 2,3,4,5-tetrahydropyridine-2,6-dicarboxylate N-succinyltransferase [Bdellovibrionales bacterium]|nr:2,3,4,5-tetrahydropyridine-2,6-dicarboxylate N-succinyltransferase [Bdellovibrionales bacterium]